ncbi:chemotaxis protein CheB [Pelagicoccus sp. SDUM812002]|uniref:chemotaxis protein CheB n=1 Tax=Pelagicoccus sp. SDUM812002 TaxID=3041266 RepID=UPI0028109781|nr:chemotaxis protein CheB [Pelagicoccus sp. SDUM812002]MDQ8186221.1 chemotaxis protein CheB [Pelagicoccus sp. SDUM812002]
MKKSGPTEKSASKRGAKAKGDGSATGTRNDVEVPCVVVGVGASAGGLGAYREFFEATPANCGMAFVLVHHMDPRCESLMAELLSKSTRMPVVVAENAMPIHPNRVYLIPPGKFMKVVGSGLYLEKPVLSNGIRKPIDHFFRSLADQCRDRSVAVVLSGTGDDGSVGLQEINGLGGIVLVQEPESAEFDGMPLNAIATGLVDFVVPASEMPEAIAKYNQHRWMPKESGETMAALPYRHHYDAIVDVLHARTDYDFCCYKRGTLGRRVQRRMGLLRLNSVEDYLRLLREDEGEGKQLFKDLLISVTAFFREGRAWDFLQKEVISKIVADKTADEVVRIWAAGCATGEEAYSLGMVVLDEIARQEKKLSLVLFATDLDEAAIDRARHGEYPGSISEDVSQERLTRYFVETEQGNYRVRKALRESMVFATQNVISDPPFSKLDVVSCRNLLIYLEPHVQRELFKTFHFALRKRGYLFLGTSETIGRQGNLFEELSKTWRIYRKVGVGKPVALRNPPVAKMNKNKVNHPAKSFEPRVSPVEISKRLLLDRFAPACVVISQTHEIHYFQGAVRDYLDFPSGEPTHNLMSMCTTGLRSALRKAVQQSLQDGSAVDGVAPEVARGREKVSVSFTVEPLMQERLKGGFLLITFRDTELGGARGSSSAKGKGNTKAKVAEVSAKPENGADDRLAAHAIRRQLEHELQSTREDLQSTVEEFETSNEELKASSEEVISMNEELQSTNEELKASNEEVLSMNEELQSTNDELETSRSALQSLNEKLSAVNSELEAKMKQVEEVNNDLTNLLSSTEIATLFLDTDFRIRRFTPATTSLLHVIDSDIGRPVSDLAPSFNDEQLYREARQVLAKLTPIEREVYLSPSLDTRDDDEVELPESKTACFMRRILPYRTSDNRIDGVVVTYTDITRLRNSHVQLELRERQAATVSELGQTALSGTPIDKLFQLAVEALQTTLGSDFSKVLELRSDEGKLLLSYGLGWKPGLVGKAKVDVGVASQAGYTLQNRGPVLVKDLPKEKRFQGPQLLTSHGVKSGVSIIIGSSDKPWGILATHSKSPDYFTLDDATFVQSISNILWEAIQREQYEWDLEHRLAEISAVYENAPVGLCLLDTDLRFVRINKRLAEMNGKTEEEHVGHRFPELFPGIASTLQPIFRGVLESGMPVTDLEVEAKIIDEKPRLFLASYYPLFSGAAIVGVNCVVRDITEQKLALRAMRETERRLSLARDAARLGIYDFDLKANLMKVDSRVGELWGVDSNALVSYEEFAKGIQDHDHERVKQVVNKSIDPQTGGHLDLEYEYTNAKDGITRWLFGTGEVIFYGGEAVRMVGTVQDITERKQSEESLLRADQRKDEFLAVLAHELRNPMAALSTGLNVMKLAHDDEETITETREIMENQVRQLTNLVNDLMDVARFTRNKLELRKEVVSLADIIRDAVDTVYPQIQDEDHELVVKLPRRAVHVDADRSRMCQVIANLLTNAAKFTPKAGKIEILVRNVRGSKVSISIKDSGIGLSEEEQAVIFDMFTQTGSNSGVQAAGLGIGLTLVKGLVEKHGGAVSVTSDGKDKGSTFVLTLPRTERLPAASQLPDGTSGRKDGTPLKVLIADDNEAALRTLASVFTLKGHVVKVAEDGEIAVEQAAKFRPDLVVMDIGMPKLEGHEAIRQMKRRKWAQHCQFVALSGWGQEKDKEKALAAGFDRHLTKPASIDELEEALSTAVERTSK